MMAFATGEVTEMALKGAGMKMGGFAAPFGIDHDRVAGVVRGLIEAGVVRVVIACERRRSFAAALFGTWQAGLVAELPPDGNDTTMRRLGGDPLQLQDVVGHRLADGRRRARDCLRCKAWVHGERLCQQACGGKHRACCRAPQGTGSGRFAAAQPARQARSTPGSASSLPSRVDSWP